MVVGQSAQPDTLPAAFADQPQQVSPDPAAPIVPLVADVAAHDDAYPEPGPMGGDGVTGVRHPTSPIPKTTRSPCTMPFRTMTVTTPPIRTPPIKTPLIRTPPITTMPTATTSL